MTGMTEKSKLSFWSAPSTSRPESSGMLMSRTARFGCSALMASKASRPLFLTITLKPALSSFIWYIREINGSSSAMRISFGPPSAGATGAAAALGSVTVNVGSVLMGGVGSGMDILVCFCYGFEGQFEAEGRTFPLYTTEYYCTTLVLHNPFCEVKSEAGAVRTDDLGVVGAEEFTEEFALGFVGHADASVAHFQAHAVAGLLQYYSHFSRLRVV